MRKLRVWISRRDRLAETRSHFHLPLVLLGISQVLLTSLAVAGPVDSLLKIAPPHAAATLVVEDAGSQIRSMISSPLAMGLRKLPAVRNWLKSDDYKNFERAKRDIETTLGQGDLGDLIESLLGDAIVLSLEVPPGGSLDGARGLLLVHAHDVKRLTATIESLNRYETKTGQLVKLEERRHADRAYIARHFQPGGRTGDFYITFDDGRLAWSDNEKVIQGVLERSSGQSTGLLELKRYSDVRARLPEKMLIALYLDPTVITPLLAQAPLPQDPQGERVAAMFGRYLSAMIYAGLGVEFRDGFHVHIHESLDPKKLDSWQKRWSARAGSSDHLAEKVPITTVAIASGLIDLTSIREAVLSLLSEGDVRRVENLTLGLSGLLLGLDPARDVLPRLGPAVLAYLDDSVDPKSDTKPPVVGVVGLADLPGADSPRLVQALENCLKTLLAFRAAEANGQGKAIRVETTTIGEATVVHLAGAVPSLAFAMGKNYLAAGTSVEAVAGFVNGSSSKSGPLAQLRTRYFADSQTYASIDCPALARMARRQRASWGESATDIESALELLDLFTGAYVTTSMAEDASWAHHTIGLVSETREPK